MAKEKLADVMEHAKTKITAEEAQVLCKLGMSQIQHSEKARKALTAYLEHVLAQESVSDDAANATINILRNAATTIHRDLCDKVLTKYLSKFDGMIPEKKA